MKMVYIYVDADNDIVGVYEDWRDAIDDLLEDNENLGKYVTDEKTIFEEISNRLYQNGDNFWYNILWSDDDEKLQGCIYQRPFVKKR